MRTGLLRKVKFDQVGDKVVFLAELGVPVSFFDGVAEFLKGSSETPTRNGEGGFRFECRRGSGVSPKTREQD